MDEHIDHMMVEHGEVLQSVEGTNILQGYNPNPNANPKVVCGAYKN